jgi:oligosaccharide repeat unit polymerase
MIYLIILLGSELIIFGLSYIFFKGDFLSLSLLSTFLFLITTTLSFWGYNKNQFDYQFHLETTLIISIGLLTAFLAENVAKQLSLSKMKKRFLKLPKLICIQEIVIEGWKTNIIIILDILMTLMYAYSILKLGMKLSSGTTSAISAAKQFYGNTDDLQINIIVRQSYKLIQASAYIHIFIFVNNSLILKKKRNQYIHIIPVICACIVTIFAGARTDILRLLSAAVLDYLLLIKENNGWKSSGTRKFLKTFFPVIIVFTSVCVVSRSVVKYAEMEYTSFIDYIIFYLSSPLQVLNVKFMKGFSTFRLEEWGGLTFRGIWTMLNQIGFTDKTIDISTTYVFYNSYKSGGGNADTIFGSPIIDFGLFGMVVFVFVLYFIFSYIYYSKLKYTYSTLKRNNSVIMYSFAFYIFVMSYYDVNHCLLFSYSGILTFLILCLLIWFYFKLKVKIII